jgi:hypothetical protein
MTPEEFLTARIAEDEAVARALIERDQWHGIHVDGATEVAVHIERFNPARVLIECKAKRELLAISEFYTTTTGTEIVRALVLPYTHHPDFPSVHW